MRRPAPWLFPASLPIVLAVLAAAVWGIAPGKEASGDFLSLTVSSSPIAGQEGKVLIVSAIPAGGGAPLARICAPIDADPFTLAPTAMTDYPADQNPCGPATPDTAFMVGSYTIHAAVYVGGSQTPEAETEMAAEITSGSINVELDGEELSESRLFGDVDCDGDVDTVDALGILKHVAGLPPLNQHEPCPNIGS